jgi:hypothetical protein
MAGLEVMVATAATAVQERPPEQAEMRSRVAMVVTAAASNPPIQPERAPRLTVAQAVPALAVAPAIRAEMVPFQGRTE